MMKKIYIRTFGCQMNEHDSEIIRSMVMHDGYEAALSYEDADLIIFNTCSVRKHAEDRVWGKISELKGLKNRESPHSGTVPIIGLVGCMAKAHGKDIFKRLPSVDFICSAANIYDIPALVDRIRNGERHLMATSKKTRPLKKVKRPTREESSDKIRAWVNISEGCDNFCSYCIVPYVRGREISRPGQDIIDEIKALVDTGIKEVTLLGQNVNSYKDEEKDFIELLELINSIDGLKRIRFMTSHPKDASPQLFKAMHGLDKVCEHIHLPLQSGSDRILKAMNRKYTVSHYLKLVEALRKELPDAAITTDIIVGFPTESEEDFMGTYMAMQKIGFDGAFIFKYSPRPFTKAADIDDDIRKEIKEERNQSLLNLQSMITREKKERLIGSVEESLGISHAKRSPASSGDRSEFYIKGRTRRNSQVVYKGDKSLIGSISDVKIRDIEEQTLIGELV